MTMKTNPRQFASDYIAAAGDVGITEVGITEAHIEAAVNAECYAAETEFDAEFAAAAWEALLKIASENENQPNPTPPPAGNAGKETEMTETTRKPRRVREVIAQPTEPTEPRKQPGTYTGSWDCVTGNIRYFVRNEVTGTETCIYSREDDATTEQVAQMKAEWGISRFRASRW